MDTEKRKEQRQFYDTKVRVGDTYGQSRNISMGGMSCVTSKEVPTLKILDIILYLDDEDEDVIKLKGTALRCSPITKDFYEVGIYFNSNSMNNDLRQKLANFLGIIIPNLPERE
jgi:hypothetical protein